MSKKETDIAFIGLGTMGMPMALRLINKGFAVAGYDLVPEKAVLLAKAGGIAAASAREASARSAAIISMLPTPAETESVVLGDEGIIQEINEDKIFIDMSTSSPALTQRLYAEVERKKGKMLDAPVSGGQLKAKKGQLTIMVGGPEEVFKKCKKIFYALGKQVHYTGDAGSGHRFKLLSNLLYAINMCGAAEVLNMGEKMGLKLEQMLEVFNSTSASSYCLQEKVPLFVITNDYAPGMRTDLLLKDLKLALEMAAGNECPAIFGKLALHFFQIAQSSGFGAEDNSAAVYKIFQLLSSKIGGEYEKHLNPQGDAPAIGT